MQGNHKRYEHTRLGPATFFRMCSLLLKELIFVFYFIEQAHELSSESMVLITFYCSDRICIHVSINVTNSFILQLYYWYKVKHNIKILAQIFSHTKSRKLILYLQNKIVF